MDWLTQLIALPETKLALLLALAFLSIIYMILRNEARRDKQYQERDKQHEDVSAALKASNDALAKFFTDNQAEQRVVDRELSSMVEAQGEVATGLTHNTHAIETNTAQLTLITTNIEEVKRANEETLTVQRQIADATVNAITTQTGVIEKVMNAFMDAIHQVRGDITASEDNMRHLLQGMNSGEVAAGFIHYDVHHIVDTGDELVTRNWSVDIPELFGLKPEQMKTFSPAQLAGRIFDVNNAPIPHWKTPSARALKGVASNMFQGIDIAGKRHWMLASATPILIDNRVVGVIITYQHFGNVAVRVLETDRLNHYPHVSPSIPALIPQPVPGSPIAVT